MDIIKLTPRGFCKGVVRAIHIINKALENDNLKKPIYMLGNIVHNKNIVKAFEEKGYYTRWLLKRRNAKNK